MPVEDHPNQQLLAVIDRCYEAIAELYIAGPRSSFGADNPRARLIDELWYWEGIKTGVIASSNPASASRLQRAASSAISAAYVDDDP
jgi:hypothetical protein